MIRFLQLLFVGHVHKWKVIRSVPLFNNEHDKIGNRYDLQCEHCGNIKQKDSC